MSMGDASSLQFPQFLSLEVKKETKSKDLCKRYTYIHVVIFHSLSEFLQTTCLDDGHSDTYLFLLRQLLSISEDEWSNPLIFNKVRNSNGRVLKMLNSFWDDGHLVILGDTPCPHPSNCLTYKQTNSATLFMGTDKWISYLYVKTLHLLW